MTFLQRAIIFLALTQWLASCASAPDSFKGTIQPPPALDAYNTDIIWGVNGHPFTAYPDIPLEQQLDLTKELGVAYYRVNLGRQGTVERLAQLVNMAHARGIRILPILQPPVSLENDSAEDIYRIAYNYGHTYASAFKGRMPVWELENELEIFALIKPCEMRDDGTQYPCEWGIAGGVGPLEYYGPRWEKVSASLKGLSDGVKAGDPDALRAIGTAGWGHTGAFYRLVEDGVEWDISVWHVYQTGPENEWAMEKLLSFDKPIWITEYNHPLGSQESEQAQADGVRAFMRWVQFNYERYNIQSVQFYELLDEPYWSDFEAGMGLYFVARGSGRWQATEPKLAFDVIKDFIRAMTGAPASDQPIN